MSDLRKKIAQMLIIGFSGYDIHDDSPVVHWLKKDGLGGVLLFDYDLPAQKHGKNLRDKQQIQQLNYDLQSYANQSEQPLPLLIAIDYEGGRVDRLSKVDDCMKTITPREQGLLNDADLFEEASNMAMTIKELGFNLNFAPVVDLNLNDQKGIIGKLNRAFSNDPKAVDRAAKIFVEAFTQQGIACAYKHFPGHGSAIGDTHEGFVDVTTTWNPIELNPYYALNGSKSAVMIMTAHVINRHLDQSGLPATLSYPILTELLRNELGFDGVIVSDDLQMQAISDHYSIEEALRLTINAGADMVIFGNQLGTITGTEVVDVIEKLVKNHEIPVARIHEAYDRIALLKRQIGG